MASRQHRPFLYSLRSVLRLGIQSLWLHRMRSGLTMLGMVFGVASVIAMLAVGEGASHDAQEQIRQQGSHNIILQSVKPPEAESGSQASTFMIEYGITQKDLQRIEQTVPTVEAILPARRTRKKVWHIGRRMDCDVVGTLESYPAIRNHRIAEGRFFTASDARNRASVCVLGAEVAPHLFPIDGAIGQKVRIESDYYEVVGVMEPRGVVNADSQSEATTGAVYIPLQTSLARFGEINVRQSSGSREVERVEFHEATIRVADLEHVIETSEVISDLLKQTHDKPDYVVTVPLSLLRAAEEVARIFNIVLGSIAAISLLVGGIGIMNIMLASVSDRTREIGVRRAVGARRSDIVVQFLAETVLLSASGGIVGVILGIGLPELVSRFADQTTIVTPWSPMLAFTISVGVGIVFGLYPAMRAANMAPVVALRHE